MADFQEHIDSLRRVGAEVIALSVDSGQDARAMVEERGLDYTVLYGLDAYQTRAAIGCYINEDAERPHLHATGFILDTDARVAIAVYSSGAIGRLVAKDVVASIRHMGESE